MKTETSPETHFRANIALSSMTIVACITLAILLWSMLAFRDDTHPLIYVTAGLLIAMAMWHIQTLWRTILLKKQFKKNRSAREMDTGFHGDTAKLLDEADLANLVPATVTEQTTNHLAEKRSRSS